MKDQQENIRRPKVTGLMARRPNGGLRAGVPDGIKKIIAVHSGKGGVGKTFVAVNLAAYLANGGMRVGLLDADIDCPNVMKMLRMEGKLVANAHKKIVPLEARLAPEIRDGSQKSNGHGSLKVVSMAPMQSSEDQAIMWRGPVISKVIEQFIHDTEWGSLDYLIVDLPPGTGDAPITVLNILKGAAVLIVTTPQELAVVDAKKSANMAKTMNVPLLGLIENMCGEIFGSGDEKSPARIMAEQMKIPFLGLIDLKAEYVRMMERGEIPALQDRDLAEMFKTLVSARVA